MIGKTARAIYKLDPQTGEVLERFNSMGDAAKSCGLVSTGNFCSACSGKQKTAGGFKWRYADETN